MNSPTQRKRRAPQRKQKIRLTDSIEFNPATKTTQLTDEEHERMRERLVALLDGNYFDADPVETRRNENW